VFLVGFPLLIVSLALYNMMAFFILTPQSGASWGTPLYTVHLPSGVDWAITYSDAFIGFSLFLLFIEVTKATGAKSAVDHVLSFLVFGGAVAEFLLVTQAANSTFAELIAICFVDFIAGIAIRVRVSRQLRRAEPALEPPVEHHEGVSPT